METVIAILTLALALAVFGAAAAFLDDRGPYADADLTGSIRI